MTPVPSSPVALLDQLDAAREAARDGGWPGVERMRLIDEAEPKLTAAVRAVLELADEAEARNERASFRFFDGSKPRPDVQVDAIRAALTAALSVTP